MQLFSLKAKSSAKLQGFLFSCPNFHQWNWAMVNRHQVHYFRLDICKQCGKKATDIRRITYRV